MSRTDQLLACAYPWGKRAPREVVGEPALYGSAFHEVMAGLLKGDGISLAKASTKAAKKWGIDAKELRPHVASSYTMLDAWLRGANEYAKNFMPFFNVTGVECAYALELGLSFGARRTELPDELNHVYPNCGPWDFPGTADLVILPHRRDVERRRGLVLDHKTGVEIDLPNQSGQHKSLALAVAIVHQLDEVIVATLHSPREGLPTVYADTLDRKELAEHGKKLKEAFARIGDGTLRPGQQCDFCQALLICPTQASNLVELGRKDRTLALDATRVGLIHAQLAVYRKLDDALSSEMRQWIRDNGPAVRPDGKLVVLVPSKRENLSKASIERNLPPLQAKLLIEKLRKLKVIEESSSESLRAVNE
jgi:hypothetical protein